MRGAAGPVAGARDFFEVGEEVEVVAGDCDGAVQVVEFVVGRADLVDQPAAGGGKALAFDLGILQRCPAAQIQGADPGEGLRQAEAVFLRSDPGLDLAEEMAIGEARVGQGARRGHGLQGGFPAGEGGTQAGAVAQGVAFVVGQGGGGAGFGRFFRLAVPGFAVWKPLGAFSLPGALGAAFGDRGAGGQQERQQEYVGVSHGGVLFRKERGFPGRSSGMENRWLGRLAVSVIRLPGERAG